ncbi:hypothetical protein BaRGS_00003123 [Batillaria attramentaria]|uniref:Uncharacterized protein n=1 Tax=Batillaria attramentaria TaxID=370345 RepID=A0ABD0M2M0_9CAEN
MPSATVPDIFSHRSMHTFAYSWAQYGAMHRLFTITQIHKLNDAIYAYRDGDSSWLTQSRLTRNGNRTAAAGLNTSRLKIHRDATSSSADKATR